MISPFVPLYPWLHDALDDAQLVLAIAEPDEDDPRPALTARDVGGHLLDLRHGATRYAVLRALAEAGHSRPWAIGAPWSPLTDEQAGRAVAEIVRAVGEDPSKPAGVVPFAVFGAWTLEDDGAYRRRPIVGEIKTRGLMCALDDDPHGRGWCIWDTASGDPFVLERLASGPETGEPGRLAADTAARALGCLMIEDQTP